MVGDGGGRFRDSYFSTSLPTLTLSVIFIIAILVGMKCYFTVLLIWFDAQRDVDIHIFVYVFFIGYLCIFFVEKSIQITCSCLKCIIYLLIIEL